MELFHRIVDHIAFKVAAGARINLYYRNAQRINAFCIVECALITFYYLKVQMIFEIADSAFKKTGFAGAR